jgi:hypothetical protein
MDLSAIQEGACLAMEALGRVKPQEVAAEVHKVSAGFADTGNLDVTMTFGPSSVVEVVETASEMLFCPGKAFLT